MIPSSLASWWAPHPVGAGVLVVVGGFGSHLLSSLSSQASGRALEVRDRAEAVVATAARAGAKSASRGQRERRRADEHRRSSGRGSIGGQRVADRTGLVERSLRHAHRQRRCHGGETGDDAAARRERRRVARRGSPAVRPRPVSHAGGRTARQTRRTARHAIDTSGVGRPRRAGRPWSSARPRPVRGPAARRRPPARSARRRRAARSASARPRIRSASDPGRPAPPRRCPARPAAPRRGPAAARRRRSCGPGRSRGTRPRWPTPVGAAPT